MSDDEVENLINNIADDFEAPGVENIHAIAASRKQARQTAMKFGGVAAIAFLAAGIGISALRPDSSELDTSNVAVASAPAVADDSAPVELNEVDADTDIYLSLSVEEAGALAEANGVRWRVAFIDGEGQRVTADLAPGRLNFSVEDGIVVAVGVETQSGTEHLDILQRRLIAIPRWSVISREGIPESTGTLNEVVRFYEGHMALRNCQQNTFSTVWAQGGFAASPDPDAELLAIECAAPDSGILLTPMPPGIEVAVKANSDATITLTSDEWTLTLSANPNGDEMLVYLSLPVEEAGDLAEANNLPSRVVRSDRQDLPITKDLRPDRLNFTTQDGIVIDVRSDSELQPENNPPTTTTTAPSTTAPPTTTTPSTTAPPTTTPSTTAPPTTIEPGSEYVSLSVEEAGALAEANSLPWRVVRIDGEDLIVTYDYRPGRLSFTVVDGIVTGVSIETTTE